VVFSVSTADSVVTDGVGVGVVRCAELVELVLVLVVLVEVVLEVLGGGEPVAALPAMLNDCTTGTVHTSEVPSRAPRWTTVRRVTSRACSPLAMLAPRMIDLPRVPRRSHAQSHPFG